MKPSLQSYVSGFILSIVLTLAAYFIVVDDKLSTGAVIFVVSSLAIVQLFVQMVFFLHIGQESEPRWRLLAFSFMTIVVGIIVGGSVWIMTHLDYNHLQSPQQTDSYLREQGQKGF